MIANVHDNVLRTEMIRSRICYVYKNNINGSKDQPQDNVFSKLKRSRRSCCYSNGSLNMTIGSLLLPLWTKHT